MSFVLYVFGFFIVTFGVAWGLTKAGLSAEWVAIICVILIGLGVVMGVSRTRMKDPPTA